MAHAPAAHTPAAVRTPDPAHAPVADASAAPVGTAPVGSAAPRSSRFTTEGQSAIDTGEKLKAVINELSLHMTADQLAVLHSAVVELRAAAETAVAPPRPPVNVDAPYVSQENDVLSCTMGNWEGAPSVYAYEWLRGGTAIAPPAAAATYTVTPADAGQDITAVVHASYTPVASPPSNPVAIPAA